MAGKVFTIYAACLVLWIICAWILMEPDSEIRRMGYLSTKTRYYQWLATIFGEKGLQAEVSYNEAVKAYQGR